MIKLLSVFLWSMSVYAGVGGIDGGAIHFQKESSWVNVVHNKSLCFKDEHFFYEKEKCVDEHDRQGCRKYKKIKVSQPQTSTKKRCVKENMARCLKWEAVPYFQKRNRIIKFVDDRDHVLSVEKIRVKSCR